jgi:hypothetical protein
MTDDKKKIINANKLEAFIDEDMKKVTGGNGARIDSGSQTVTGIPSTSLPAPGNADQEEKLRWGTNSGGSLGGYTGGGRGSGSNGFNY